jgi:predicted kinase
MMILINGPFGVGKTTTAQQLIRLLPNGMLFDPELIGAFLRGLLGHLSAGVDYQDLPLWRSLTVALAGRVQAEHGVDPVIPMTLWRRDYFDEIANGLRANGANLICVQLVASRETLTRRILSRPEADGPHDWCLAHLEAGLAMASDPAFGTAIPTDGQTPRQVAEEITRSVFGRDCLKTVADI